MIVVEELVGKLAGEEARRVERVVLGWEDRLRSRQRVKSDAGTEIGIALPTGQPLAEGDVLFEDDERVVVVSAVPEDVLALYADSAEELARIAYQVGNRHAPVSVGKERVLTPYDSVIEEYFRKIGVRCERVTEPFTHEFGVHHNHHH
ncbi:MAG: urease accessory protein UreE [Nitrospinaceae bacterium]|jgi:urease accessory protein|nr:urease accessory protein UreE [Nitrospinaceae bacterium]MBT4429820.1 urease accessory protein UreE [Nitrospinaceae bacterium]MBT5369706.1 urease accessory protein UreE [Nitrospinaceae bacterium]MBT5949046.1 urease accessory protein UreE [Nitrospinaceae bacterium]MBT6394312.1 urease accessory protein UreE [Nitrospinaceae bacterium]